MKIKLLIFSMMVSVVGWGQIGIPNTTPVTQNFDAMAAGATAGLPANWKMSVAGAVAPTWGAVGNFTAVSVQASSGSPATGGRYNWGNAAATDRSLGVLTSGGYASPNSIMAYYRNTAATNLTQLSVSYNLERYKVNTAAASVQFFYSLDGTAWTALPAGDVAAASLPTGVVAYGFPGLTINVGAFNITGLNIASNSDIYLRWNLNTTGANSQGIGIDDVSVTGTFACAPPSTQASVISTNTITTDGCNVAWTAGNGNGTMIVVRPTASSNAVPVNGTPYTPNLVWGSAGIIDPNNRVVFRNAGTTAGPITGLTPGTQYTVTAYEYNTASNCYNMTSAPSTTFYTLSNEPIGQPVGFSCTAVSSSQIDLSFPPATASAPAFGYIILQSSIPTPTGVPVDGNYYSNGTVLGGDATVVSMVSAGATSFSVTGLTAGTTYYYSLIPYNSTLSIPATLNYLTSGTISTTNCTTSAVTLAITSPLTSSSVYGSAYSYAITASGGATAYNAVGLPAGLSIDTVTGIISGTPTVGIGTYNIDISATDGVGTDTKTLVLTITAKNLTISGVAADNKVYDRTLTATLSGTPALVGVVGADDVAISGTPLPLFGDVIVGTTKPVTVTGYTLSGIEAINYTVSQPTGLSADITPRPLAVSGAVANNKVYNGTTAATITGAALVGVIAPDVVNITPSGTFATANAGTAIAVTSTSSISGADSSNYSLTQPTGLAADITQASQTITFGALSNQYSGAANFTLMATASSGLTITYVSSNPAVATVSGNTVTIVGIGTTVITASQTGNGNYTAAVDINQNQVVTNVPCLNDSFTSATFPPAGWLTTSVNRSTTATDYVTGPAAATFASNTGSLTTSMVANPAQLRFYLGRSGNTTAKTLTVEISITSQVTGFSTIATYDHSNVPASSYNQYTVDLSAYTIYPNVWIRFVKTSATTSPWRFDDLEVFCGTVWNGSVWSNGVPNLTTAAVINGDYNTTTDGDIHASSLTVNPTFTATVTPNHYITIENNLTVNGVLNIQNNGSLVQVNDSGINTGNINMQRTASVDRFDYVYWSTPVTPFVSSDISPTTTNTIYKWLPTTGGVNGFGNWANGNETMVVGKGYAERGLNNSPLGSNIDFTATFTGVPNNGIKTIPISRGTYDLAANYNTVVSATYATKDDDNWNFIGNPYPSSISAEAFLQVNTNIAGFVKIWRHGIAPLQSAPDPFYSNYGYNYDSNDYLTYNKTGASAGSVTDYFIGAGQGFFILMNHSTAATTENVLFNNDMRRETYRNDMFYKAASHSQNNANEKGRIWLDIISATSSARTLIGYVDGATNEKERSYDAITDLKASINIYSLIGFEGQIIQGRQLPFDQNDQVPIGIKVSQNGNYTIAIAEADGFFTNNAGQNIYLEDKMVNTIHDLRSSPYNFTANTGIYNDRFVLRYTNQTLGNNDFGIIENSVNIYTSNNGINISSELESIKNYEIYNILGQTLAAKKNVNTNEWIESSILKNNQTLIVKVILENGQTVTKKILF
jgi:hypothetical protein